MHNKEAQREFLKLVRDNQVVLFVSPTGTGKTITAPAIVYAAFQRSLQIKRVICSEPRILNAMGAVKGAQAVHNLGNAVGYMTSSGTENPNAPIIYATDGLVWNAWDTLVDSVLFIDEVHEFNKNMEMLMMRSVGMLKANPNARLVLMSATVESKIERIKNYFAQEELTLGIYEAQSETVHPIVDSTIEVPQQDLEQTAKTFAEKAMQTQHNTMIFVSGEKEMRILAKGLRQAQTGAEILMLSANSDDETRQKVTQPCTHKRIWVATNVAQAGVTPYAVSLVISFGERKIIKTSWQGIETLAEVTFSKEDYMQQRGRTGRTCPGEFLLVNKSFESLPEEIPADILRTNIDKLVLDIAAAGYDPCTVRFVNQPEQAKIEVSTKALVELEALDTENKITDLGREMSKLVLEPQKAKAIVLASKEGMAFEMMRMLTVVENSNLFVKNQFETNQPVVELLAAYDASKTVENLFLSGYNTSTIRRIDAAIKTMSQFIAVDTVKPDYERLVEIYASCFKKEDFYLLSSDKNNKASFINNFGDYIKVFDSNSLSAHSIVFGNVLQIQANTFITLPLTISAKKLFEIKPECFKQIEENIEIDKETLEVSVTNSYVFAGLIHNEKKKYFPQADDYALTSKVAIITKFPQTIVKLQCWLSGEPYDGKQTVCSFAQYILDSGLGLTEGATLLKKECYALFTDFISEEEFLDTLGKQLGLALEFTYSGKFKAELINTCPPNLEKIKEVSRMMDTDGGELLDTVKNLLRKKYLLQIQEYFALPQNYHNTFAINFAIAKAFEKMQALSVNELTDNLHIETPSFEIDGYKFIASQYINHPKLDLGDLDFDIEEFTKECKAAFVSNKRGFIFAYGTENQKQEILDEEARIQRLANEQKAQRDAQLQAEREARRLAEKEEEKRREAERQAEEAARQEENDWYEFQNDRPRDHRIYLDVDFEYELTNWVKTHNYRGVEYIHAIEGFKVGGYSHPYIIIDSNLVKCTREIYENNKSLMLTWAKYLDLVARQKYAAVALDHSHYFDENDVPAYLEDGCRNYWLRDSEMYMHPGSSTLDENLKPLVIATIGKGGREMFLVRLDNDNWTSNTEMDFDDTDPEIGYYASEEYDKLELPSFKIEKTVTTETFEQAIVRLYEEVAEKYPESFSHNPTLGLVLKTDTKFKITNKIYRSAKAGEQISEEDWERFSTALAFGVAKMYNVIYDVSLRTETTTKLETVVPEQKKSNAQLSKKEKLKLAKKALKANTKKTATFDGGLAGLSDLLNNAEEKPEETTTKAPRKK